MDKHPTCCGFHKAGGAATLSCGGDAHIGARMKVVSEISIERIANLLCSALEGGSNYWYQIVEIIPPAGFNPQDSRTKLEFMSDTELAKMMGREPKIYSHIDYPCNRGGALIIRDIEDTDIKQPGAPMRLDLEAMQRGLQLMVDKAPKHWGDFLSENDDATTADVFLQLCLFGDVIYG